MPVTFLPAACEFIASAVPDENELREWVSRGEPEKEHETGRIAVEQGLVLLPQGTTIGFEEFMSGRTRDAAVRVRVKLSPLTKTKVPRVRTVTESPPNPFGQQMVSWFRKSEICSKSPEVSSWVRRE